MDKAPRLPTPLRSRSSLSAVISAAAVLAWLGMLVHNLADLPGLTLSSPETSLPAVLWLVLLLLWHGFPARLWPSALLFSWGLITLAGGLGSVLPLPVLPFEPEQSLRHYAVHALYALTQLPLLFLLGQRLAPQKELRDG